MLIHRGKGYVVLTPPKTGSNSLNRLLIRPAFGAALFTDMWHHNTEVPADCREFRVYLAVRHPLARAASLYRHLARDDWGNEPIHPFSAFCRRALLGRERDPFFWQTLGDWAAACGLPLAGTIRLESLREDLAALEPDGPYVIPHENPDPALRPASFWYDQDPAAYGPALEWGLPDMERFGYREELA